MSIKGLILLAISGLIADYLEYSPFTMFLAVVFFIWGTFLEIRYFVLEARALRGKDQGNDHLTHWNRSQRDIEREYGTPDWQEKHKK